MLPTARSAKGEDIIGNERFCKYVDCMVVVKKRVYVQYSCVYFSASAPSIVSFLVLRPDTRKELSSRLPQFLLCEIDGI